MNALDEPTCHFCGLPHGLRPFNLRVRDKGETAWRWSYACPSCWRKLRPELREPDAEHGIVSSAAHGHDAVELGPLFASRGGL